MSSLLERRNQAISVTEVARSTKNIIDRLASGQQDKYVVMRNNAPAAVLLPVAAYEALQDELADLRVEALARERLQSYDPEQAITHEDMVRRFASE
ncbi:MAG: type II toxin-antitoxin system prevent-host-death family antitoxin [Gammaproteobacteria bacterium]